MAATGDGDDGDAILNGKELRTCLLYGCSGCAAAAAAVDGRTSKRLSGEKVGCAGFRATVKSFR